MKDAGLKETDIDKEKIFLFSNSVNGREISNFTTSPLVENVRFFDSASENFSDEDYIYFYGNSPSELIIDDNNEVNFSRNPYTLKITIGY